MWGKSGAKRVREPRGPRRSCRANRVELSIARAFEGEHTTAMYSGILRMADLLTPQPNMDIKLHIVAPVSKRDSVFQEIRRPGCHPALPRVPCGRERATGARSTSSTKHARQCSWRTPAGRDDPKQREPVCAGFRSIRTARSLGVG